MWPRARSKLYEEPKKLVALGLAEASREQVGRRPRTVYSITDSGKQALAEWLARPGEGPSLEFEQLLKVFFSENGTKTELLFTLNSIRTWARDRNGENIEVARSYVDAMGPFPERAAQLALTGRFLVDFADMVDRWADWAAAVVETWPDDPALAEPDWSTLREIAARGIQQELPTTGGVFDSEASQQGSEAE